MTDPIPPRGYLAKLLATDEEVLLIAREHAFVPFGLIFGALVFMIVIAAATTWGLVAYGTGRPWIAWGYLLALLAAPNLFWNLAVWRARQYVVTTRRVIQISGVFGKNVVDSALDKVTDVRTDQSLLGRMLNYGDVEVLTASETGRNLFHMISAPLDFKRAMLDAQHGLFHPVMGQE